MLPARVSFVFDRIAGVLNRSNREPPSHPVARPVARTVRPRLVLAICCMSLLMSSIDATIVNVALPSIRHDLHAPMADLQWTVDAYTLVVGSFLISAGALADRYGRRSIFQCGLVLFALGSGLCSLAGSARLLVLARVVQALGATMLNPVAMSIITNVFPDPKQRAQAIGVWAAVPGLSMAIGPFGGGLLIEAIGWRSIFWINLPICALAMLLTTLFVPAFPGRPGQKPDLPGQVLVTAALGVLVGGIIEGGRLGFGNPVIAACFALAAASVALLVLRERRTAAPLLDLRFFRSVPFASANLVALCAFSAFSGFLFLNTFFLQDVRHLSPPEAGLWLLPIALVTLLGSPLAGRLVGRRGPRPCLLVAGFAFTLSALLLQHLRPATPGWQLILAYAVFGVGFAAVNPPITNSAVAGMPRARAGTAAAIASSGRQIGNSIGVALAGAIAFSGHGGATLTQSWRPFWWLLGLSGLAIASLGLIATSRRALATQRRIAHLLDPAAP